MGATGGDEPSSSLRSPQARGKGAVGPVSLRQDPQVPAVHRVCGNRARRRWLEAPRWMLAQEPFHDRVVLLRLQGTGAVDQQAARLHLLRGVADQRALL